MNTIEGKRGAVVATVAISLGLTLGMASTAPAFVADACGIVSKGSLAKAFKLRTASTDSRLIRGPGNSAGVIRDRCVVLAWTGRRPKSPQEERRALLDGTAASLRMETWVPDDAPSAEIWRNNFATRVRELTSQARRAFRGGREIKLPRFGVARSLGFQRVRGGLIKLRGFWWSPNQASIVAMTLIESRSAPAAQSLKTVAEKVVPEIH